jgi:nitrate reductase gamma subunit
MLLLLIGIGATGLTMKFVMPVDILMVKQFFLGLMRFQINELPMHPGVLIHLGLVAILMIIFPISKLMHAPGLFFAPSRTQVDNAREFRHLSAWASQLEDLPESIPTEEGK